MRESIGGAWLFGIVITFITLFSGFLAYSISYTKAFNLKNQIINYIEQSEGYSSYKSDDFAGDIENDNDLANNQTVEGKIYYYIKSMGYSNEKASGLPENVCNTVKDNKTYSGVLVTPGGYCITKICQSPSNKEMNTQYKVTTFITFEVPIIGYTFRIPISGETRTLYYDSGKFDCTEGVNS